MTSPLEGSLARTIGKAMSALFLPATLTRTTPSGTGDPWNPDPPTNVTYSCRAIEEEWGMSQLAGGLVLANERKVLVLASTLAVEPAPGDRITVRGHTLTIVPQGAGVPAVSTDPAKAVWVLRAAE